MNNLVAEKRLDKNNRLVTKYVKPAGAAGSEGRIPAPTAQSDTRKRDVNAIVSRLKRWYEPQETTAEEIAAKFDSFGDDTLRYILDTTSDSEEDVQPSEIAFVVQRGYSEATLREYLAFSLNLVDCEDGDGTVEYIQGLHHYSKLRGIEDLSRADEDTQQACHTLLKVTWMYSAFNYEDPAIKMVANEDDAPRIPILKSAQLVNLIMDHPDRGDDIIEFLEERGYKINALKDMLTLTPRALKNGWL